MGSRYFITGTQIGMIIAFTQLGNEAHTEKLMQEILDKQYIGTKEEFDKLKGAVKDEITK